MNLFALSKYNPKTLIRIENILSLRVKFLDFDSKKQILKKKVFIQNNLNGKFGFEQLTERILIHFFKNFSLLVIIIIINIIIANIQALTNVCT